jgi:hypothetical protein
MLDAQIAATDACGAQEDATRGSSREVKQTGKDGGPKGNKASPIHLGGGDNEYESSEEDVDESVKEDMRKLEETFAGISDRFRLINRIGEGKYPLALDEEFFANDGSSKGLSRLFTRPKTSSTTIMRITGISVRTLATINGRLLRPKNADWAITPGSLPVGGK